MSLERLNTKKTLDLRRKIKKTRDLNAGPSNLWPDAVPLEPPHPPTEGNDTGIN